MRVVRRPIVSVLATGDELETAGSALSGGRIYDSNSFSVAASVLASGGTPRLLGIARDNLEHLHQKLAETAGSDLVITSAGVSKGDYDIVKDVLNQRGSMNFWSVRMRPAKPLAFGHLSGDGGKDIPLLGLPGNPVSAMVAFEMFARPAIRMMLGLPARARPAVEGVLTGPIFNYDGRRVYARVEVERRDGSTTPAPPARRAQHIDVNVPGQWAGHLPGRPAPQGRGGNGAYSDAGLERGGCRMTIPESDSLERAEDMPEDEFEDSFPEEDLAVQLAPGPQPEDEADEPEPVEAMPFFSVGIRAVGAVGPLGDTPDRWPSGARQPVQVPIGVGVD